MVVWLPIPEDPDKQLIIRVFEKLKVENIGVEVPPQGW